MLDTILFDYMLGIATGVEGATEYLLELSVKTSNAQFLKIEILLKYLLLLHPVT
jgi:hypothetical protein